MGLHPFPVVCILAFVPGTSPALNSRVPEVRSTPAPDAVAQAMGGKERVLAVRTLVLEGTGELLFFGPTHTPDAKTQITLTGFRRSYDFVGRRWLLDQTRESRFLTPMPPPLRVRLGLDGAVGYNVPGDGDMAGTSASVATDRSRVFISHPIGFIQAA